MHSSFGNDKSLWRWRELLPLPKDAETVSLGEGGTPLLQSKKIGAEVDVDLWIKEESLNPTQSFKARGMSVAVSMAKYLGSKKLAAHALAWKHTFSCRGTRRARTLSNVAKSVPTSP
jgi:threonine synthase